MLNWAVRYFTILRVLRRFIRDGEPVLEIGAGAHGLAKFYHYPFVGCDIRFVEQPRRPMLPVLCSGTALPFADQSFDAAIASDVLEHIAPERRRVVIGEALRVARRAAVFGFPSGADAFAIDQRLLADFQRRGQVPPEWLEEHMLHPFPGPDLFEGLSADWTVGSFGNEHLRFHYWLAHKEMDPLWSRFLGVLPRVVPSPLELALRLVDREPFYRRIFVVARR
ncbi:MAG: hypothetical protein DMG27_05785 [Acidobacteria bacterium]|nr:MAG: hypothetical protein DMG27_05785 [Acidobacteriota bacterium]